MWRSAFTLLQSTNDAFSVDTRDWHFSRWYTTFLWNPVCSVWISAPTYRYNTDWQESNVSSSVWICKYWSLYDYFSHEPCYHCSVEPRLSISVWHNLIKGQTILKLIHSFLLEFFRLSIESFSYVVHGVNALGRLLPRMIYTLKPIRCGRGKFIDDSSSIEVPHLVVILRKCGGTSWEDGLNVNIYWYEIRRRYPWVWFEDNEMFSSKENSNNKMRIVFKINSQIKSVQD